MTNEEASEILYYQWQSFLENNLDYGGVSEAYKKRLKHWSRQGGFLLVRAAIRSPKMNISVFLRLITKAK